MPALLRTVSAMLPHGTVRRKGTRQFGCRRFPRFKSPNFESNGHGALERRLVHGVLVQE